jgi:excisionase family DNA binding protein
MAIPLVDRRFMRARPLPSGRRRTDPPLTTRECADWMGMSTEFIRGAIKDHELEAEDITVNGRRVIRIHQDAFRTYLQRIGWKRLPKMRTDDN